MGIEIINEPNTTTSWPMMNVTERYKAVDAELAEGTGPIEFDWLKNFYITAYRRLTSTRVLCRLIRLWYSMMDSISNSGRTSCVAQMASLRQSPKT